MKTGHLRQLLQVACLCFVVVFFESERLDPGGGTLFVHRVDAAYQAAAGISDSVWS